jgi:hypothetical protein
MISEVAKLLRIFKCALWIAIKRPSAVIKYLHYDPLWLLQAPYFQLKLSRFELSQLDFIAYLFPERHNEIQAHFGEIYELYSDKQGFFSHFQPPKAGSMTLDEAMLLYVMVRLLRPENVVETGPGSGMSSTFILAALEMNRKGLLYSIDLPKPQVAVKLGQDDKPGWLIPKPLRRRWKLILGKSEAVLPPLLKKLGRIDIFFHDSLHSFKHQKFEYENSWPCIKTGGLLLSHDINKAYFLMCQKLNVVPIRFQGLGGIRKRANC